MNSFVSPITTTTTTTTKKVLVKYFGALGKICTSALLKVWKQFVHFTRVLFLQNLRYLLFEGFVCSFLLHAFLHSYPIHPPLLPFLPPSSFLPALFSSPSSSTPLLSPWWWCWSNLVQHTRPGVIHEELAVNHCTPPSPPHIKCLPALQITMFTTTTRSPSSVYINHHHATTATPTTTSHNHCPPTYTQQAMHCSAFLYCEDSNNYNFDYNDAHLRPKADISL